MYSHPWSLLKRGAGDRVGMWLGVGVRIGLRTPYIKYSLYFIIQTIFHGLEKYTYHELCVFSCK